MPFILQHRIYSTDLKNNPDCYYVFGDNEARYGRGGQAKECRGHPNAIGIPTKVKPSNSPDAFWSDDDFDRCYKIIDQEFLNIVELLKAGKTVIFPSDGIGSGLSQLPQRAPRLFAAIQSRITYCKSYVS